MNRIQHGVATAIAIGCLGLMVADATLAFSNRRLQAEIGGRQQYVQQSAQLEGLYREIVRALAELAARNNDGDVRALLQSHGISYSLNAPAAAPAATAVPPARGEVRK